MTDIRCPYSLVAMQQMKVCIRLAVVVIAVVVVVVVVALLLSLLP